MPTLSVKIEITTIDIPRHCRDRLGVKQRELAPRIIGLDCSILLSTEKVPGHLPRFAREEKRIKMNEKRRAIF